MLGGRLPFLLLVDPAATWLGSVLCPNARGVPPGLMGEHAPKPLWSLVQSDHYRHGSAPVPAPGLY